jgi:hypothetical protein
MLVAMDARAFEIRGGKWGAPEFGTPGGNVTYGFVPQGALCSSFLRSLGCAFGTLDLETELGNGFETVIDAAFEKWSAVADIDFEFVPDSVFRTFGQFSPAEPDIRIGTFAFTNPNVLGLVFGDAGFDTILAFNSSVEWEFSANDFFDGLRDLGNVALHEIGHAIGLEQHRWLSAWLAPWRSWTLHTRSRWTRSCSRTTSPVCNSSTAPASPSASRPRWPSSASRSG